MVRNVHERWLAGAGLGGRWLLDSLAGPHDRLWPRHAWPATRLDRPLGVGATGGHGPVRYTVEKYVPRVRVRCRLRAPAGFRGYHEYEVLPDGDQACWLRHALVMTARPLAWVTWPLFYRPLPDDTLIEDSLRTAARELELDPGPARHRSVWVACCTGSPPVP